MWQSGVSFSGVVTGIDVEADEVVVVVVVASEACDMAVYQGKGVQRTNADTLTRRLKLL
jgi:hypothetical protein